MSNALAIAAATATLRQLLRDRLTTGPDPLHHVDLTILPLDKADKARGANPTNQLNLFLYQIQRNAAWVNADMPRQVQSGETGFPPLPLNLWYLLTAYGEGDDTDPNKQPFGHHVLGKAMSILHDNPVLSPADIAAATQAISLPAADLDRQIERIRITFQPLSVEEIYRLWTGFATPYRLSAAYEVAVTLIESKRPTKTPLPVLTRGQKDKGISSQPDLMPPFPGLTTIAPPNNQPSAMLNDLLTLTGYHLDGTNIGVQFNHPLWTAPREVPPQLGGTATQLSVKVPDAAATWPAGFYTIAVLVLRGPDESNRRSTNQLTFSLAPQILNITPAPAPPPAGRIAFTVRCRPQIPVEQRDANIRLVQRVTLLLGDRELPAEPPATPTSPTDTLTFAADNVAAGDYFVRLRVDGVDSLLVDRRFSPPRFDDTQKVTIP